MANWPDLRIVLGQRDGTGAALAGRDHLFPSASLDGAAAALLGEKLAHGSSPNLEALRLRVDGSADNPAIAVILVRYPIARSVERAPATLGLVWRTWVNAILARRFSPLAID